MVQAIIEPSMQLIKLVNEIHIKGQKKKKTKQKTKKGF